MALTQSEINSYIAKAQRAQETGMLSIVQGKRSGKKGDSLYYPMEFLSAGVDVLNSNHGLTNLQVEIIIQEMIEQGNLNDISGDPIPYQTIYVVNPATLNIKITDLVDGPMGNLHSWPGLYLRVKADGSGWEFIAIPPRVVTTSFGITAHAGGGQGSATSLPSSYNYINTVVSNDDSVIMKLTTVNDVQEIQNNASNQVDIYPQVGERFYVYGTLYSVNAPFVLAGGQQVKFVCAVIGTWILS